MGDIIGDILLEPTQGRTILGQHTYESTISRTYSHCLEQVSWYSNQEYNPNKSHHALSKTLVELYPSSST